MKKPVGKRPVGRPPGRKAKRRPVIATRVPLPVYEMIKQAAQDSGRTLSEELIWRTTQSFERDNILDEAREKLAAAQRVTEQVIRNELERTHTRIRGADGSIYWMEKGAEPLKVSATPEFKAMLVDAMKEALPNSKPLLVDAMKQVLAAAKEDLK